MADLTPDALTKAMEVVGVSPEGAQYFADRLNRILIKAKIGDQGKELQSRVEEFVKSVELQYSSNDGAWKGKIGEVSPLKNMYANIAEQAQKVFSNGTSDSSNQEEIQFYFAINKMAEFIRGYANVNEGVRNVTSPGTGSN